MPTGPIKIYTFRLWVQFHHGFLALFDQHANIIMVLWWMPTRHIEMGTFRLWVQLHHGFLALFDQNANILMGFLMVDAHASHKNADFQALGSISPWLFGTF